MTPSPTQFRRHAPTPGAPQPLSGTPAPAPVTVAPGLVNYKNRLFAPLQSLNPDNVLMGGYGWLSKTDNGATFHPGLDLNSGSSCNDDEGKIVASMLSGVVRQTLFWDGYTSGEGNHIWVEYDDVCCPSKTLMHVDHLSQIDVVNNERFAPGQPLGRCGRSGNWDCAHAHTELLKSDPQYGWYQWPYGWSRSQVEAAYHNPTTWWNAAKALVDIHGGEPPAPETVKAMNDWELTNYVLAQLYEWAEIPFNPNSGLAKTWVAALRANVYAGRPRTDERHWGDPDQGVWAEFDYRVLIYKNDGTMSWTG